MGGWEGGGRELACSMELQYALGMCISSPANLESL